VKMENFS